MSLSTDVGQFAIVPVHIAERLTATELQVFVFIAGKWADRNTGTAFPGIERIAESIGISARTVRRALAVMEREGIVSRRSRYRPGGGRATNEMTLVLAQPDSSDRGGIDDTDGPNNEDTHVRGKNQSQLYPESEETPKEDPQHSEPVAEAASSRATNGQHSAAATEVFEHWIMAMQPKRRPRFTADRRRKIEARLAEGYGVTDLKQAIDGCAASDFHMGRDPENDLGHGGKLYNHLGLIFRNGENVERFAGMAPLLLAPSPDRILQTRSVLTPDEAAEAREHGKYPFDPASERALAEHAA